MPKGMLKSLMVLDTARLRQLNDQFQETGMDFQIAVSLAGHVAVVQSGACLPFYKDVSHYDVYDLLAGDPIPDKRDSVNLNVSSVLADRAKAAAALPSISPNYPAGAAGAFPLVKSYTLPADTVFYRCLSSSVDHRYVSGSGELMAGTYLTTQLDQLYVNTGFAAVGRFALPIPLPASNVFQYELRAGTIVRVGTVAPMFGQAGGGVEVQTASQHTAKCLGAFVVPDF
jgi:hypothetical protein